MACSHEAPNGKTSALYSTLEQIYGPDKAHDIWTVIRGQQFLNSHGDWTKGNEKAIPLDDNQEPTYGWVKGTLQLKEPTPAQAKEIQKVTFEPKGKTRISESALTEAVRAFYDTAIANPDTTYELDYKYISDRRPLPIGYNAKELAAVLDTVGAIPDNIIIDPGIRRLIDNSYRRIKEEFSSNAPVEFINRDRDAITDSMLEILTPKLSVDGKIEGFFNPLQQQETVDSIIYATKTAMDKDPNKGINALIFTFYAFQQKARQLAAAGVTSELRSSLEYIDRQRKRFAEAALRQMEGLGLFTDPSTKAKILRAVDGLKPLGESDKQDITETPINLDTLITDSTTGEFTEVAARGLKDWSDVSFELDPKDTASSRIKMFIATMPDTDRGTYKAAESAEAMVTFDPSTIVIGDTKLATLITKEGIVLALDKWAESDPKAIQTLVREANRKTLWAGSKELTNGVVSYLSTKYPLIAKDNYLGLRKLVDFEATFQDMLETLADNTQSIDLYISMLNESGKPNLQYIAQELLKADDSIRNEFSKVMSKQYQQFVMVLFNRTVSATGETLMNLNPINANRYNQRDTIIKNWQEQQKVSDFIITSATGDRVMDVDRIRKEWVPALTEFNKIFIWDKPQIDKAKPVIQSILQSSGITMTDPMMSYLFGSRTIKGKRVNNIEELTKDTKFTGNLVKQFSIDKNGEPAGLFSIFIMKAAGLSSLKDSDLNTDERVKQSQLYNPLYTEKGGVMKVLSKVAARYTPVLHSSNHRSSEGKNIWDYGHNTKLSHKFRDFLDNFEDFYDTRQQVDVAKDNWLLNAIRDTPKHLESMQLGYLDGLKPTWGKKGTVRTAMSDREQMLTTLSLFQNQGRGFNSQSRVNYISLTHSDKTTTPVFMNMPRLNTGRINAMPTSIIGPIGSVMYNVFKSEYSRIVNQADIDYNDAKYNRGKNLFYFIPQFNYDVMQDMVKQGKLTQKQFELIWVNGERSLTKQIRDDRELPVINTILAHTLNDLINKTKDSWEKNGITNANDSTNLFDKNYLDKLNSNITGVEIKPRTDGTSFYTIDGKVVTQEQAHLAVVDAAAKDFAINYFLFNTTMSQLFYGDPAQTFKGKTGAHDLVNVASTMKEYAKRLAKDIAPGHDPSWDHTTKKFNTITLADVTPAESYFNNFPTLKESYAKVEGTDAQELTTVQEHLDVKYANGEIRKKIYDEMKQIIRAAGPGGYYEFTIPEHLAVIMQPAKPVFAGTRVPDRGAMLDDYIKSSSYPLYPPFTAGTEMEHLRVIMEGKNPSKTVIQRANFESAKKIGSPTQPARVFNNSGTFTMPSAEEFQAAQRELDRSGFRIQQEVPYDEEKAKIKTVSQMNKLITEGIAKIEGFVIGNKVMNGTQVRSYKEEIRTKMILHQLSDLFKELGVSEDAMVTGNWKINDKQAVYKILAEEAKKKGYTMNELQSLLITDEEGNLAIPLMFNTAADKLESMLMSMVKKVIDVKMPGKSFVQASSVGLKFTKEEDIDKSQVVWAPGYSGGSLKTLRQEDGTIKAAQVLLPFNFTASDGSKLNVKDFAIRKGNKWILDPEKIPIELTQLIGARIPNQGHNSMLPIEVVGFIPANMGDLIIVPSAITKQMGADFDVDKLYTYRRNYKHDSTTGKLELSTEEGMKQLQDQYFDVHWGVLMHPEMMEKILSPLDKDDLKNENNKLAKSIEDTVGYYDVLNQLSDFQSGKEAKTLVGSTSLSVTFNSVIQNYNLRLFEIKVEGDENGVKYVEVDKSINVIDEHTGKVLELHKLSGNGVSYYTEVDGDTVFPFNKRTKHDNHTTVQSASVDNAKDRSLDNLNLTTNTYRAASAFIQLETKDGRAVNLKYITRLMTQPIIKEFDARMKIGNDSLSDSFSTGLRDKIIEDLRQEYIETLDKELPIDAEDIFFSPQTLLKAQSLKPGTEGYVANQLAALNLFVQLDDVGKRLTELKSMFNQDTNGAGPNILSSLDKEVKFAKANQVPIKGVEDIYGVDFRTEQGTTFDSTVKVVNSVLTQLLPYDKLMPTLDNIALYAGRLSLTIDQQRDAIKAFRSFIYTSEDQWWSNAQNDRVRLLYGGKEQSLARRVQDAKRTWGKDNYFLQRLNTTIGDTINAPDYVEYQAASTGRIDEDQNNRGWLDMLISNDPEVRNLGEDLIRYSFLTGGVQDANSFVKYVPTSYIANTEFGDMLKERMDTIAALGGNTPIILPGFITQYLQHNPQLAAQINKDKLKALIETSPGTILEGDYPEVFKVPDFDSPLYKESGMDSYTYIDENKVESQLPFISYRSTAESKWILYNYKVVGDSGYYMRIDTLGNQYSDEYYGKVSSSVRSIFPENRSAMVNIEGMSAIDDILTMKNNSLGNYYQNNTPYEQFSLKEGGITEMKEALSQIIDNTSIPNSLRTVAGVMLTSSNDKVINDAFSTLGGTNYTPKLIYDKDLPAKGQATANGTITLNPNAVRDVQEAAETYLHEYMHHRLQTIIQVSGFDERIVSLVNTQLPAELRETFFSKMQAFSNRNPEVIRSLTELERIRNEAFNSIVQRLGQDRINEIINDLQINNIITSEDHSLVYGLSSLQEMVAHVMTDKTVMGHLNSIKNSKGETLIDRIWNALTDIIDAIGRTLGVKVNKDSLLKEAIAHTLKLTTFEATQNTNITTALVQRQDLRIINELDANASLRIIKENYGREATMSKDELGFTIQTLSNAKLLGIQQDDATQVGKVIRKLNSQLKEIGRDISQAKTSSESVAAKIRYHRIIEDVATLQRTRDLNEVARIGQQQLQWVDHILNTDSPSATNVQAAIDTANIWSGLTELLYGDLAEITSSNKTFDNIQAEAQRLRIQLINRKASEVVINALSNKIRLTSADLSTNLEELNAAEANFLTLSRTKAKLVQGIAVLGRQAANNKTEESNRLFIRLRSLNKRMKAAGVSPNDFLEDGEWALVQRLDSSWYNNNAEAATSRDKTLESLNKSKLTPDVLEKKRTEVWDKYWKNIKSISAIVDTRIFFDFKDGSLVTGAKYTEAFNKLTKDVGSEEYAKELLNKAHELFKDYIQEREVAKDYFEQEVALTETEKTGKSAEEMKELLKIKQQKEITNWLTYNSPNGYLNRMDGKSSKNATKGERFVVTAPLASKKEYYNKKYLDLQNTPTKFKLYEEYKAEIEELISYLPATEREKLNPGFLPIVSTDTITNLAGIVAKFRNWDATLMNTFAATEQEEFARVRPDEIPVMYTRESSRMKQGLVEQSNDIMRVTEVFGMMALHYKYMAPVLSEIEVAESIIKEVNRQRVTGEVDGKVLRNLQDAVTYFKDALIYKKPKLLEGKIDTPIYSMNVATQMKIQKEVKELNTRREEIEEEILKSFGEGESDVSHLSEELDEIQTKLDNYAKSANMIYGSKATDFLISVNQLKALSWNPFSAVSNFTFGMVSVFIHGTGRMDYTQATTRKAMGIMMNSVGKYYAFGTIENKQARKILSLMERIDIMGDVVDTQYGQSNLRDKKSGIRSILSPFNWQRSGDYFAKGTMMVSMLLTKEVEAKVKETGESIKIPLWEALDDEGKWDTSKYEENTTWYSDNINEQTEWNNYRDRIRKVGILVFGNQDKNAPLMAKKNWLKRLVGQFRMSWFPEGLATRFIGEREDAELGRTVKGRWRTYGTLGVFTSFANLAKQAISNIPGVKIDPFAGVVDKDGKAIAEVDIENMRKNFAGLAWTIAFTASILMLEHFYDDDRKRGKKKTLAQQQRRLLLNMLIRNHQDLMLYSSPDVFQTVSGNLIPAATVITDSWKAMKATGHYMMGDNEHDKKAFDAWITKVCKAFPVLNLYPKTKFMMNRDVDAVSK